MLVFVTKNVKAVNVSFAVFVQSSSISSYHGAYKYKDNYLLSGKLKKEFNIRQTDMATSTEISLTKTRANQSIYDATKDSPLFSLPCEIRDQIWRYCTEEEIPWQLMDDGEEPGKSGDEPEEEYGSSCRDYGDWTSAEKTLDNFSPEEETWEQVTSNVVVCSEPKFSEGDHILFSTPLIWRTTCKAIAIESEKALFEERSVKICCESDPWYPPLNDPYIMQQVKNVSLEITDTSKIRGWNGGPSVHYLVTLQNAFDMLWNLRAQGLRRKHCRLIGGAGANDLYWEEETVMALQSLKDFEVVSFYGRDDSYVWSEHKPQDLQAEFNGIKEILEGGLGPAHVRKPTGWRIVVRWDFYPSKHFSIADREAEGQWLLEKRGPPVDPYDPDRVAEEQKAFEEQESSGKDTSGWESSEWAWPDADVDDEKTEQSDSS